MAGRVVSHYEILERLGGGGMGVVFKAKDTRLNRLVAIKFLSPAIADDLATKERFLGEARAVASLDHPSICTVYEIGETDDGQLYLAMAFYEGETLALRLRRGPLPIGDALEIARLLLAGLAYGHEFSIVHRDIKPANIMLTQRGEVKILDYGLAKHLGQTGLTQPGALMGTAAYMSPEQATGQKIDYQSDIWSAGAVLYEMLVGEPPFPGPHAQAIISSILRDEAKTVSSRRRDAPPALDGILRRALAKDRSLRYPTVRQFLRELDALLLPSSEISAAPVVSPVPLPLERSIVVLPFVNLHPDRESDYFADGLTDEIITGLSALRGLRVISRTATMRLKGASESGKKIAADLNVQYILEGTVRKSRNELRVSAKLIDAPTDTLVWADKYTGNLDDLFAIQETLSRSIVEALKVQLSPEEEERLRDRPISDIRAYECYLRAKQEILHYSQEGLERALNYLQNAVGIVGENILLLSALGQTYWLFLNIGMPSDVPYLEKMRSCADRILALDPGSVHGHRLLGLLEWRRGNMSRAAGILKQVLEKNPNDTDTLGWLVAMYGFNGKPWAAVPWAKRLVEIDPLTPIYQCIPGLLALMAGEFRRALDPFAKALTMEANNPGIRFTYGHVLAFNKRTEESIRVFDSLFEAMPESFFAKLGVLYKYALQGDRQRALEAATEDLKSGAHGDPQYCWNIAECFALVNEPKEALDWLERAIHLGFLNYPLMSKLDPFLENLRGESRFEQLMDKARERWEAFEA